MLNLRSDGRFQGFQTLDWSLSKFAREPRTRVVTPDLRDYDDFMRISVYRWLQSIRGVPIVFTHSPDWCPGWWASVPSYLKWWPDLAETPNMGLWAVIRTQAEADAVAEMQRKKFPMKHLILQCLPSERLVIPPADIVWAGWRGPKGKTKYTIRREWIEDLREQAAAMDAAFHFRSWGAWWPQELGGEAWYVRDGYIRGPRVPPVDEPPSKAYPSWFEGRC